VLMARPWPSLAQQAVCMGLIVMDEGSPPEPLLTHKIRDKDIYQRSSGAATGRVARGERAMHAAGLDHLRCLAVLQSR
jgi:hypothetical protein